MQKNAAIMTTASETEGPFLSRSEVADLFGVGAAQIRELVEIGHLETVPNRLYFHRAEVDRYCREGGPPKRSTQNRTICLYGHRCPISDGCKFAAAARALVSDMRVDVISPLGEWTAGACACFEATPEAAAEVDA